MTATDASSPICPNCQSTHTAIGGSGSAICTDCAHMWDPADATASTAPIIAPFGMAPVEEVFGVADVVDPETYAEQLEAMVGGIATLEGGQTAEVIAFGTKDNVLVRLSTGEIEDVPMSDVTRIMPPVVIPEPVDIPEDVDELPADLQLAITLAAVIIRAGCEAVTGTGADITPGVPPIGYLPADEALHSVVERAAGLAVGMLIEQFELDVDEILTFVGAVDDTPEEATETTEEDNGE